MAPTAQEAIQRESGQPVDEVYLDNPPEPKNIADAIGFHAPVDPMWRSDELTRRGKR